MVLAVIGSSFREDRTDATIADNAGHRATAMPRHDFEKCASRRGRAHSGREIFRACADFHPPDLRRRSTGSPAWPFGGAPVVRRWPVKNRVAPEGKFPRPSEKSPPDCGAATSDYPSMGGFAVDS